MELINPLHRGICFDLIRFHSIAENIINEYILMFLLSYSVLFSRNQTRWPCHPAWNMLSSSVPSHWWPSCIIAMNQFSWANPIIQCLCASHFCAHFQSVESIWAKKEQVAHRYIKFSIWIMNSGHPHLVCQRRKESELTIQAKIKKGSFWKFWHKANSS